MGGPKGFEPYQCVSRHIQQFLLFGDSYTRSYFSATYFAWPLWLTTMLDFNEIEFGTLAYPSATTDQFAKYVFDSETQKLRPWGLSGLKQQLKNRTISDFLPQHETGVMIWIGFNDIYKEASAEITLQRLNQSLTYLRKTLRFTDGYVYLLNLPPFQYVPGVKGNQTAIQEQQRLNAGLWGLAHQHNVTNVIDIHSKFMRVFSKRETYLGVTNFKELGCKGCFFTDSVHPSSYAHQAVADVVATTIWNDFGCPINASSLYRVESDGAAEGRLSLDGMHTDREGGGGWLGWWWFGLLLMVVVVLGVCVLGSSRRKDMVMRACPKWCVWRAQYWQRMTYPRTPTYSPTRRTSHELSHSFASLQS